jgi:hypothetical protein
MAVYLQEKTKTKIESILKLTPATQVVFINFFMQNSAELAVSGFAKNSNSQR